MEAKLDTAEKKVLVDLVKVAQKQGMRGTKGNWKEFLNSYDKQLGASLSDPSRRSRDSLAAFLKTFNDKKDLKYLAKVLQCHVNRDILGQLMKKSLDDESPKEKLVRATLEHPEYPLAYSFPSYDEEWVVTKISKNFKGKRSNAMLAVDCEMVLCEDGTEALVRVCVVDSYLKVKLDEFVKPSTAVLDYRTEITGITAADLDNVTSSLVDIQKSLKKLLSHGTILVGHSLHSDLQALKMDHAFVIDTSLIFRSSDGPLHRRPSLNNLCKHVLGYEVRKEGDPHNCLDDACAAMKLVLALIERGPENNIITLDVREADMSRLLLHRISANVPLDELHRAIPGNFKIEVKPSKKPGHRNKYSAFAIFDSPQEALDAFENVLGSQEKDSSGLPQKLVNFHLSSGAATSLYIRKMAHDNTSAQPSSRKRANADAENLRESKKLKADEKLKTETMMANAADKKEMKRVKQDLCEDHLKEIERLKEELSQSNQREDKMRREIENLKKQLKLKDFETSNLHKIVSKLSKKSDL